MSRAENTYGYDHEDWLPDVIVCECGAAVSWAVYLDHHGCKAREPDPTEDTTEEVECECGAFVLGAGWLKYHRGGRCHKDRMARKAAIARAFVVRPIDWYWCDECGSQVHTWDREGHRARMHSDADAQRRGRTGEGRMSLPKCSVCGAPKAYGTYKLLGGGVARYELCTRGDCDFIRKCGEGE